VNPQDITEHPGENAVFLIFGISDWARAKEPVQKVIAALPALVRSLRNRFPDYSLSAVMGFGAAAWKGLFPEQPVPGELAPFEEIRGEKHTAPSTPGDLFFHFRGRKIDALIDLAAFVSGDLGEAVSLIDETHAFRYQDSRAIIGFVDGTENPEPLDALEAAAIGPEDPVFAGGSYAMTQKYVHDLAAWSKLPVEEQEKVIGRRKFDDRELSEEEKPENAHNAVTNISDPSGRELKIVRANAAFASPAKGEYGTYFIGYASAFSTTRRMLENMFVGDPPGNTDRLLEYSRALTGTLFFVPSRDLLAALGE
jgi:putative iron-dependent peroxidase